MFPSETSLTGQLPTDPRIFTKKNRSKFQSKWIPFAISATSINAKGSSVNQRLLPPNATGTYFLRHN